MNIQHIKYKDLDKKKIREIKRIHQKIFNEPWETDICEPLDDVFLLQKNYKIVGMAIITKHSPNYHFPGEKIIIPPGMPYMCDFGIIATLTKKGIGSMFLQQIIDMVKKIYPDAIYLNLNVKSDDFKTILFYKKNNFRENGYYSISSENSNEYVSMTLSL